MTQIFFVDRITPEQRRAIWIKLEQNRARLCEPVQGVAGGRSVPAVIG